MCSLVSAILASAICSQNQAADQLYQKAERARKEDKVSEALAAYKALLDLQPEDIPGHVGYQKLLLSQEREKELVDEYRVLLEKRGGAGFHYLYGRLLRDPRREEELYRKGLALDPKRFELRIALADALRRDLRREDAAREFRTALADNPEALREHLSYIKLMRDLGKPDEVLFEYERRSQTNPKDFRSHLLHASALLTFGLSERAKEHLDRALELGPGNPYVLGALGIYYAKTKDIPRAQRSLEEALRADPYHAGTLYQLGVVRTFLANDDGGIELLKTAARLEPDSSTIFSDLGASYLSRMKLDPAEKNLKEALRLDPTNDWAAHRMGLLAVLQGNHSRAVEWQEKAISLNPHVGDYHAALAKAYERTGEADKARAALEKAEALRRK